jgi:hypothetical protein
MSHTCRHNPETAQPKRPTPVTLTLSCAAPRGSQRCGSLLRASSICAAPTSGARGQEPNQGWRGGTGGEKKEIEGQRGVGEVQREGTGGGGAGAGVTGDRREGPTGTATGTPLRWRRRRMLQAAVAAKGGSARALYVGVASKRWTSLVGCRAWSMRPKVPKVARGRSQGVGDRSAECFVFTEHPCSSDT